MDTNYWRVHVGESSAAGAMDTADWRTQMLPDSRQRVVNKIMETLRRHLPVTGQEGVRELTKIAMRFEEKIYGAATSQQDYLRTIARKMLTMETKAPTTNAIQPNAGAAANGQNAHGPVAVQSAEEETDDEQATEEDDEIESEGSGVTEEQKTVAGHKENVEVGENETSCGLSSGAKLDDYSAQVDERLKNIEAHTEELKTLLADMNKKLNYLVKMHDVKAPKVIQRPTKYMRSSWTGNGQPKKKHRIAEMIRESCRRRRLGSCAVEEVSLEALHDECAKDDQRKSDEEQKN